jgi:23S rRNA pseudouridine2605 synthase
MTKDTPRKDSPVKPSQAKPAQAKSAPATEAPAKDASEGERIAKVIARAGRASRREAEQMIEAGRVTVNGKIVERAALNVTVRDKIVVDGVPLEAPEAPRLWLYHKPTGLVTTTKDEQGRPTIYDDLPEDMPRVMSVGRLDLNSEGLLLLTNDGGVKRKLELPSTGWLRRYRVRVNGQPTDQMLQPLRDGIVADGQLFQPMIVTLDRQQGSNAWLTVGLREGKNREIRRAMDGIGLTVNRLIRISYGPFQLGQLKQGEVEEVRRKILRDQLGLEDEADDTGTAKPRVRQPRKGATRTGGKPGAGADGTPGQRPGHKSGPRSGERDGQKPGTKPGARTAGKPGGKAGPKGGSKFGAKAGQATGGKEGFKSGSKPASKAGPKSGAKSGSGFGSGPRSGSRSGAKPGFSARKPRG